jgi:rRNA maturation RNase YbeY
VVVRVRNAQHEALVRTACVARFARFAIRHLGLRLKGTLAITFISARALQRLNKQFLGHDYPTDVLSFRYDEESTLGEILISPRQASTYASSHGLSYEEELGRYVVHGILHWLGHEDRTTMQQRKMRALEDQLLAYSVQRLAYR